MAIKRKPGQLTEIRIALRLEDAEKGGYSNPNMKFILDENNPLGVDFICSDENAWMVMDEVKRYIPALSFLNLDDYWIRQSSDLANDIFVTGYDLGEE